MCLIGSSWNSSLGQSSSWITLEPIWWCFWPKGNLRPILWSLGSLRGPQISQNKLTTALFLRTPEKKHTVEVSRTWLSCKIILLFTIGDRTTVTKTARINFSHLFGGAWAPPLPTHTAGSTLHNLSEFLLQGATFINLLKLGHFKLCNQ